MKPLKQRVVEAGRIVTAGLGFTLLLLLILSPIIYWSVYFGYCKVYHFNTPLITAPNFCKN